MDNIATPLLPLSLEEKRTLWLSLRSLTDENTKHIFSFLYPNEPLDYRTVDIWLVQKFTAQHNKLQAGLKKALGFDSAPTTKGRKKNSPPPTQENRTNMEGIIHTCRTKNTNVVSPLTGTAHAAVIHEPCSQVLLQAQRPKTLPASPCPLAKQPQGPKQSTSGDIIPMAIDDVTTRPVPVIKTDEP